MTRKRQDWWKLPSLIVAGVAALGALGTIIVKSAAYITLPARVEAGEAKNTEQDTLLTRLTTIEEQNQALIQQMRVEEVADDGEIKTLLVEGVTLCCDGRECWRWSKKTKCDRHD